MLILYSSSGCASCRKAKQWLRDNHIEFIEKNIYTTLMKEDEIKYLLSRCENGTQDIISLRSKVYRSLKKDFNELSTNELIRLIQNNPSILKRPIILSKNNMVVGFDDEEITSFTPHHIRLRLEDRCPVSCANLDICRDVRKNESKESLVLDIT
ncbi:Spx/MgsR family RNA polymerase-binding regulatory protein [Dubosiella muris]|uniref:Spx/MgsR family RNA polymerase-binding regulatory protein n=1 Tax=Dubosiella muris TaxID=3038133 RepID=A0AC61RAD9_9FIRM|nr:Spx/MgsR family RNA polymerase-binding regulatory protein [Dubosiella muris]TGY67090.1 Spx/MgsR family RNA polymerase-binding regulatory protein [Dubosiella muris]